MARRTVPPHRSAGAVGLAMGLVAACSGGSGASTACGPITREALDPAYLVHVLDEDADVEYTSDPPTSGPHKPIPPDSGIVDRPLGKPVQVGILERGDVLLQHDPELPAADVAELEALAGDQVVVAPNPDLPEPVVATAWLYKRTCEAVDTEALQEFIAERTGKGPGG